MSRSPGFVSRYFARSFSSPGVTIALDGVSVANLRVSLERGASVDAAPPVTDAVVAMADDPLVAGG